MEREREVPKVVRAAVSSSMVAVFGCRLRVEDSIGEWETVLVL